MNYVHFAEQYYKQAPYDWVKRVLKFHEQMEEENTLKPTNSKNTSVSHGNPPRERSGPGRTHQGQQERNRPRKYDFYPILVFGKQTYFSLKAFYIFLSFFHFLED